MSAVKYCRKIALSAAFAVAALAASTASANAQVPAEPIERCRETTDNDKDRIACLEAAIVSLMGARASAQNESEPPPKPTAAPPAPSPAAVAETEDAEKAQIAGAAPTGLGAEQVARRARVETPAPRVADAEEEAAEPAEETEVAEAAPAGLGAEQVIAKQERATKEGRKKRKARRAEEAVTATLIDFARTATGRLILVLDNGQVWAQRASDAQDVRLRDGDTPSVRIRRGALSGYRMELSDPNVTITVERLK